MSTRNATFYTDGTSALSIGQHRPRTSSARIIKFEKRETINEGAGVEPRVLPVTPERKPSSRFRDILESSEMYCSLRLESMLGCPYKMLSTQNVACIAVGSTVIGLISLILGS